MPKTRLYLPGGVGYRVSLPGQARSRPGRVEAQPQHKQIGLVTHQSGLAPAVNIRPAGNRKQGGWVVRNNRRYNWDSCGRFHTMPYWAGAACRKLYWPSVSALLRTGHADALPAPLPNPHWHTAHKACAGRVALPHGGGIGVRGPQLGPPLPRQTGGSSVLGFRHHCWRTEAGKHPHCQHRRRSAGPLRGGRSAK